MTTYRDETTDPDVLDEGQERALLRGAPWRRFVVLGDSIAAGVGDPVEGYAPLSWSQRVERALRRDQPGLEHVNLGVRDLRVEAVRETQLEPALACAPDLAVVIAGGNDALARTWRPEHVEAQLDAIVGTLQDAGAAVALFGLFDASATLDLPDPWGPRWWARMSDLRALTGEVAARHDAVLIDCTAHRRGADPSIYSADLMHLNMRGHAIAGSEAIRSLSRVLAPAVGAEAG